MRKILVLAIMIIATTVNAEEFKYANANKPFFNSPALLAKVFMQISMDKYSLLKLHMMTGEIITVREGTLCKVIVSSGDFYKVVIKGMLGVWYAHASAFGYRNGIYFSSVTGRVANIHPDSDESFLSPRRISISASPNMAVWNGACQLRQPEAMFARSMQDKVQP
jgi:hypothetical protein